MVSIKNLKELSFLIYGLGETGKSVIKFFERNNIKKYKIWDDKKSYKRKETLNLEKTLNEVNYIVLSPGVSLKISKNKNKLLKHKDKIITDIDLVFLLKGFFKSIVVTGTNGKSTTCEILNHLLLKNKYQSLLGGNIGTPILDLQIKKNSFLIIEASSFQLAHSKFICPDYAILLNITNDHLDWHGTMKNYIDSKFKIFQKQKQNQYSFVNNKLKSQFKKRKMKGKLIVPNLNNYKKLKSNIKNSYLSLDINNENMSFVYALSKALGISKNSLINSLKTFKGLPHRYEIFLKSQNCIFINDSKATTFQATKFALENTKNIFWIVGGLPKKKDRFYLKKFKKNILKAYIIGNNISFFKNQLKNKVNFEVLKSLKKSVKKVIKDIKIFNKRNSVILFSPAAASFDQFLNFENRGEKFKFYSKFYARKLF